MTLLSVLLAVGCGGAPTEAPPVAEAPAADAPAAQAPAAEPDAPWSTYGPSTVEGPITAASALLDAPSAHVGKTMVVQGEVADVCQKAGCWMVVADGARTMRVRMKDHDFAVPKDCAGEVARIHGTVVAKDVDPEEVAHFASEAANPEVAPEAERTAADVTYELVATAVQLQR